jgi:hypothetical protein
MEVRDTEKLNEQKQENSKKSSILFLNLVLGSEILFILYGSSSPDSSRQHCPPWASWPLRISHTLIELTAQCFFFALENIWDNGLQHHQHTGHEA